MTVEISLRVLKMEAKQLGVSLPNWCEILHQTVGSRELRPSVEFGTKLNATNIVEVEGPAERLSGRAACTHASISLSVRVSGRFILINCRDGRQALRSPFSLHFVGIRLAANSTNA